MRYMIFNASMLLLEVLMVLLSSTRIRCLPLESDDSCPLYKRSSAASLSSEYAADTIEDAEYFPNLLSMEPRVKIDSTPWWGERERSKTQKYLVQMLSHSIKISKEQYETSQIYSAYSSSDGNVRRRSTGLVISQVTTNCTAQKALNSNLGIHTICAQCNVRSVFDVDRLPREVNELICDPSAADPSGKQDALNSEGTCIQKTLTITVLKDNGNGNHTEESYDMGTACEFTLYPNSVLLDL